MGLAPSHPINDILVGEQVPILVSQFDVLGHSLLYRVVEAAHGPGQRWQLMHQHALDYFFSKDFTAVCVGRAQWVLTGRYGHVARGLHGQLLLVEVEDGACLGLL